VLYYTKGKHMKNLKYIPTKKIVEILDSNYCMGVNGREYSDVKEELEQILWERQNRIAEQQMIEMEKQWQEYEEYINT
jgi:hypothetical protein